MAENNRISKKFSSKCVAASRVRLELDVEELCELKYLGVICYRKKNVFKIRRVYKYDEWANLFHLMRNLMELIAYFVT